jgi:hypothetical protein
MHLIAHARECFPYQLSVSNKNISKNGLYWKYQDDHNRGILVFRKKLWFKNLFASGITPIGVAIWSTRKATGSEGGSIYPGIMPYRRPIETSTVHAAVTAAVKLS